MYDAYDLLPPKECYAKSYGNYLETYESHINTAIAYINPVLEVFKSMCPYNDIKDMVALHDIGKRGREFQDKIKGRRAAQYIRHEELAFIKWLDKKDDEEDSDIKTLYELKEPQILAILAHHKTLIDDDTAILIETYIANHPNWNELRKRWLEILKTPRENRIDTRLFLPSLPLIDLLRTIDILASYTTETIFGRVVNTNHYEHNYSLYDNKKKEGKKSANVNVSPIWKELSSINLKQTEIEYNVIFKDEDNVRVQITKPISSLAEFWRRTNETDIS